MRKDTKHLLKSIHKPTIRQEIWEWAADNVDFSLVPEYETPLNVPYDPCYMPYWKEVVEADLDPDISECWVVKAKRAGGSENLLLNPIRYIVAQDPQPALYVGGDQRAVEEFMEERIKLGMNCAEVTARKLKNAKPPGGSEHVINFPDMQLTTYWPRARQAFKQKGYTKIYADEVSTWPVFSADMLRGRTDTYSFSHICGISSIDPQQKRPTSEDPIFVEFLAGDQRYWYMRDPKTKRKFRFEMGAVDSPWGLKWDKKAKRTDGSWDLNRVKRTARYITPDGTKINNKNRMKIVRKGKWIATNPDAPQGRRSYHLNAFYLPFKSGDFGTIACAFLEAKHKGRQQLRVFIYEYLAEEWKEDTETTQDHVLFERCRRYNKKKLLSESEEPADGKDGKSFKKIYLAKRKWTFVTADVHQAHLWTVAREWVEGGDSGLLDYRYVADWDGLEEMANEFKVERVGIDQRYRKMEVLDYAFRFKAWPLIGVDNLKQLCKRLYRDPYEGKSGGGRHKVSVYEFNTDEFGLQLLQLMRGESEKNWFLYQHVEEQYVRQAASMERIEGKWAQKKGHGQNHIWDCEIMQLVLARLHRIYRFE